MHVCEHGFRGHLLPEYLIKYPVSFGIPPHGWELAPATKFFMGDRTGVFSADLPVSLLKVGAPDWRTGLLKLPSKPLAFFLQVGKCQSPPRDRANFFLTGMAVVAPVIKAI